MLSRGYGRVVFDIAFDDITMSPQLTSKVQSALRQN